MSAPLVFLDTETTGLDPDRHEVWEIGCIVRDHRYADYDGEWLWQLKPDLAKADPTGLRIGRYYERIHTDIRINGMAARQLAAPKQWGDRSLRANSPVGITERLAVLLDGAHLVGAVPSFDAAFLAPFLRRHGQAPTWHYHLIDVEALAAGFANGLFTSGATKVGGEVREAFRPPWKSEPLTRAIGVDPDQFEKHTALGDARWAMAIYDTVMGGRS
jgi:hypothetical protein